MPTSTAALLQALYTAYREKRLADVLAHLSDDFRFTLHLPSDAMPGAGAPIRSPAPSPSRARPG